jgi:hypothetical protein
VLARWHGNAFEFTGRRATGVERGVRPVRVGMAVLLRPAVRKGQTLAVQGSGA